MSAHLGPCEMRRNASWRGLGASQTRKKRWTGRRITRRNRAPHRTRRSLPWLGGQRSRNAVHLAVTLGPCNDGVVENLTQQWGTKDLNTAQNWALSQPQGEQREQLIERIAFVRSQTDPSGAAALAISDMLPGPAQVEAVMSIVHQRALQDTAGAEAWVDASRRETCATGP
jgi:hypothetical protein